MPPVHLLFADPGELLPLERQAANRIAVPAKLVSPHLLVASRAKTLAKEKPREYGRIQSQRTRLSSVSVFPNSIDRVLKLLDTLIKACEKRNFKVFESKDSAIQIQVLGESIPINIFESAKQRDHQPTPEESEREWFVPKYDYFPTGDLQIRTADHYAKVLFSETRKRRLEDNLNNVIIRFVQYALQMKEDRLEREKQHREWLAKEERRQELLEAIRREKKRVQDLETEVENWHRAERIRAYIEAVKKSKVQKDPNINSSSLAQWITWAQQQAARFDPLAESPPSVLDEEERFSLSWTP